METSSFQNSFFIDISKVEQKFWAKLYWKCNKRLKLLQWYNTSKPLDNCFSNLCEV